MPKITQHSYIRTPCTAGLQQTSSVFPNDLKVELKLYKCLMTANVEQIFV